MPRAVDFRRMMERHAGETGLGLDDWAGLLVDGDHYRVVQPEGRSGSVHGNAFVADGSGLPGLWLHDVADGRVEVRPAARAGRTVDILRPARAVVDDERVSAGRRANPARLG